jgi:hypothetical protein
MIVFWYWAWALLLVNRIDIDDLVELKSLREERASNIIAHYTRGNHIPAIKGFHFVLIKTLIDFILNFSLILKL